MYKKLKVVTIGEIMLGLRAPMESTLEGVSYLECLLTGAEANVAIGLTRLGIDSAWIGKMPEKSIARGLVAKLRGLGVDTNKIIWTPNGRVGIMYIQLSAFPRANQTIYDRKNSAASTLSLKEVDWDFVRKASHLHLTGITPALSKNCIDVTRKAINVAKETKMSISFDVNYRSTLWSPKRAAEVLKDLIKNINILFINVYEAKALFNISGNPEKVVKQLKKRFCNEVVILSKGAEGYTAAYKDKIYQGKNYPVTKINRIGVGDAFHAGFIYGFLTDSIEKGLDYGSAMADLKLTLRHVNYPLITRQEIENLLNQKLSPCEDNFFIEKSHQVIR